MRAPVPYLSPVVYDEESDDPGFEGYVQITIYERMDALKAEAEEYWRYLTDRYPDMDPASLRLEMEAWWADRKAYLIDELRKGYNPEEEQDDPVAVTLDLSAYRDSQHFEETIDWELRVAERDATIEQKDGEIAELRHTLAETQAAQEKERDDLLAVVSGQQEQIKNLMDEVAGCKAQVEYLSPPLPCPACGHEGQ